MLATRATDIAAAATRAGRGPAAPGRPRLGGRAPRQPPRRSRPVAAAASAPAPLAPPPPGAAAPAAGHGALLHGLGAAGDVDPAHLPWLLRIAAVQATSTSSTSDSQEALAAIARGLSAWKACLNRALLPDDEALGQLLRSGEPFAAGHAPDELAWPPEPLRTTLLRGLGKLGVARFAAKYPPVQDALLLGLLELVTTYHRRLAGIEDEPETREVDASGVASMSVAEAMAAEKAARAARRGGSEAPPATGVAAGAGPGAPKAGEPKQLSPRLAALPSEKLLAVELVKALYFDWRGPMETLATAGKAFVGLEALLGAQKFEVQGNIWRRQGWSALDELRRKLENLKELRDLVRSLGRGGGWGPLRRAPTQHLDMSGRPGLLRTVLEAQETRGLTRSDDISRLLPAEAAMLAKGRTARWSKLVFMARWAEKGLQSYERDGWGEFNTAINVERREIRPTADRGPILLCVDTSGSMRGARETVAKSLALECMRAAKEQERDCFMFAFAGPAEVREVELGMDMPSVLRLLDFLEGLFNGGSDFNEPLRRCLDRLTEARWANSDILLVSDGELRQPGPDIMQKLSSAKEKLGLRVHGLIVGSPEKKRADPAVLRALCTNYLPNGKVELCLSEFENWRGVQADEALRFDWDDAEGNLKRRLAGLAHEKQRKEAQRAKKRDSLAAGRKH